MPRVNKGDDELKLGSIFVEVEARLSTLEKDLKDSKRFLKNEADKMSKEFGNVFTRGLRGIGSKIAGAFKGIGAALGGLLAARQALDISVQAKNVARDAEEIQSKFNVVFGNARDTVNAWAEQFGSAVGRARQDVKKWLSTLQDTFVPLGFTRETAQGLSKDLVKLAVDVASFNNEADQETIDLFTSALVGNHEAVRRFGIIITEATLKQEAFRVGIRKSFKDLTDLEKVQLRYSIIMRSTADAQGDAIRTANSLANLEKRRDALLTNLLEVVGQGLVPAFEKFTRLQIGLLKAFGADDIHRQSNALEQQRARINALATSVQGLTDDEESRLRIIRELQNIYPQFLGNLDAEKVTNEQIRDRLKEVNTQLLNKILITRQQERETAAVTKQAEAYEKLMAARERLAGIVAEYREELKVEEDVNREVIDTAQLMRQALTQLHDDWLAAVRLGKESREEFQANNMAIADANKLIKKLGGAIHDYRRANDEVTVATDGATDATRRLAALAKELGVNLDTITGNAKETKTALDDLGKSAGGVKGPTTIVPTVPADAIEKNRQLLADYFGFLRFEADNYREFAESQIDSQFRKFQEMGVSAVDAEKFRILAMMQLNRDYTAWLDEQIQERLSKEQLALQDIIQANQNNFNFIAASNEAIQQGFDDTFDTIRFTVNSSTKFLDRAWRNMANAFIDQVQRMITKWLAFKAITTAANLFGIPLPPIPGAAQGGKFKGTSRGVQKTMAQGGSFIVPQGFNRDSFLMGVQSGERVQVTTANRVTMEQATLRTIVKRLDALNLNMVNQEDRQFLLDARLSAVIDGSNIKLSYDKRSRQESRFK